MWLKWVMVVCMRSATLQRMSCMKQCTAKSRQTLASCPHRAVAAPARRTLSLTSSITRSVMTHI